MDDYSTIGFGRTTVRVLNSYLQFLAVGEKNRKQTARGGKHTDFPPCVVMFPGIQQPSFPKEQISSLIPITSDTKPSPPASSTGKLGRKYKGSISVTFRVNTLIPRAPLHVFSVHACDYMGASICAFIKMGIKAGDGWYSVAPHLTSLRQGPSLNRKPNMSARLPGWPASSPIYLCLPLLQSWGLQICLGDLNSDLQACGVSVFTHSAISPALCFLPCCFYHRVLFVSLLHLLLLLLLLRSSWMLFSALASAQLLLFSLPVGLFYFFGFFPPLPPPQLTS